MKKIILFLLLIMPFYVNATVENYYMEATVLNNGDIKVKEVFGLDGEYNGFDRELYYGGNTYSGSKIEIISVKGIQNIKSGFELLEQEGYNFKEVGSASKGDYGYYTVTNISKGISVRIYNPSTRNRLFYLEYLVKNMAIKHKDVGEVGYNIFTSLKEPVTNVNVKFIIPNNKNNIRVWGHGPLTGETSIKSKNEVLLTLDYLNAYEGLDIRVIFDRDVLSESLKLDDNNVLENIIEEETKKADEANRIREEERKKLEELKKQIEEAITKFEQDRTQANKDYAISLVEQLNGYEEYDIYMHRINSTLSYEEEREIKIEKTIGKIIDVFCIVYIIVTIYLMYRFYNAHDKEYKATFDNKYYRDFPSENGPEIVEYLLKRNITTASFSASILSLIYKKKIEYEKLSKNDYKLKLVTKEGLTESEEKLVRCVFENSKEITLKGLKKRASRNYDMFASNYSSWQNTCLKEGKNKNFYEKKKMTNYILFSISPLILVLFNDKFTYVNKLLFCLLILLGITSFVYYITATKRTKEGNEEYYKWLGLKNFMKDFGRMHEKELPEITLWEKYLVYATVFGIAKKLAKDMEIKVQEMGDINGADIGRFNTISNMVNASNVVASAIGEAKRTADRAYAAAHSSDSSGGGSGGGFSSGGGSFGGGGGGGRF